MTMSTSKRVTMYVLPVVVLSVALNIPKFMEATATVNENETITVEMTEMRREPIYALYFTISQGRRWSQNGSTEFNPSARLDGRRCTSKEVRRRSAGRSWGNGGKGGVNASMHFATIWLAAATGCKEMHLAMS